ncbi:DapH/DapD/GlmU-related protein [Colwellia sp. Bg11-12]|uniref:acyltransferase n=1 Tax=Colwellia sp. Bg11-12 TaxID=2759817 RepID=UPI0015F62814|nr:acyltransferase [Colwellia sp. Bg11-12]MBA6263218.1 acyltransferase [Colwellia sp. Bg11-12]
MKSRLYWWAGVIIGKNVRIISSSNIWGTGKLVIGDNTFIGHQSLILMGGSEIVIGNNVDISSNVTIVNGTHEKGKEKKAAGDGIAKPIIIKNGSWLGASVTVIAGAVVGEQATVAAGALVAGNIGDKTLVGGVPAKIINI